MVCCIVLTSCGILVSFSSYLTLEIENRIIAYQQKHSGDIIPAKRPQYYCSTIQSQEGRAGPNGECN